jgi:hypothetical protein
VRNIQIIDGAANATFSIFQATEDEFALIFPNGRDMEIAEDLVQRIGEDKAGRMLCALWERPSLNAMRRASRELSSTTPTKGARFCRNRGARWIGTNVSSMRLSERSSGGIVDVRLPPHCGHSGDRGELVAFWEMER